MDDECIGFKEVNSKKQVRLLDEVIDELGVEVGDENRNGVEFYNHEEDGAIIIRGMDL